MSTYTIDDFTECLERISLPAEPVRVLAAYGKSEEGGGEWSGGFVVELANGQFAHITGWCDYTGWG